jgi:hypothetical protein
MKQQITKKNQTPLLTTAELMSVFSMTEREVERDVERERWLQDLDIRLDKIQSDMDKTQSVMDEIFTREFSLTEPIANVAATAPSSGAIAVSRQAFREDQIPTPKQ